MAEIKPTRTFTREDPCTKVHIWNCFMGAGGFKPVAVVHSRAEIGLNTPKYLKREGFVEVIEDKGVEYYRLTAEGEDWLRKGLNRHLELHPADVENVLHLSKLRAPAARPRMRRGAA